MSLLLRKFGQIKKEENKARSIEVTDWINEFREKQGIKTKLLHKNFLSKIDKYNKEVNELNLKPVEVGSYKDIKGEKRKCYLLTKHEALIFASAENNIIKAMLIQYMDNLEMEFNIAVNSVSHTKEMLDKLYETVKEYHEEPSKEYSKINSFINMTVAKKFGIKQGTLSKENMDSEQLEFRAEVEQVWIDNYKGKKSGIKKLAEDKLL